jgi:hypothetical protein
MKIHAPSSGFWKKYYHLSTKFATVNLPAMNTCLNCDLAYNGAFALVVGKRQLPIGLIGGHLSWSYQNASSILKRVLGTLSRN